jgi:hypothetical protein
MRTFSPSTSVAIWAWKNYAFGFVPHEKTRQVFVLRVRFDHLQRRNCAANHFGRQRATLKAHGHVISPADASAENALPNERKRRIRQLSHWQIRL